VSDEPWAFCPVYSEAAAWVLEDIVPIDEPFPVRGRLGLFEVELPALAAGPAGNGVTGV